MKMTIHNSPRWLRNPRVVMPASLLCFGIARLNSTTILFNCVLVLRQSRQRGRRTQRQRWGLRTSTHTTSRDGERGIDIRHRVRWWNRVGWWDPWRTIFFVPIVRSFRTWPSSTHYTTPSITWSWCVFVFASLSDQSYNLCCWIRLPLCMSRYQTRTQTSNIFAEFRRAVPKQNKLAGITTCVFMSLGGELCMIVYVPPLRSNSTFFLYSPTILLEKKSELSITISIM